jgi:hypothetical protein
MKRLFLVLFFTVVTVSSVNAQSTLALQEKCAEGAKKFFLDRISGYGGEWGFFNDKIWGRGYNDFTSHFNKKLDKCFIRIEFHSFADKTKNAISIIDVWNVFEGIHIGRLSTPVEWPSADCVVVGKTCNSPSEFEALIKPYMEE